FHFIQLKNKSQKRLKSIYEVSFDAENQKISTIEICSYNYSDDTWKWTNRISRDKENAGMQEDALIYEKFSMELKELANG
ncbi:MAG TPA: hypothetical protein VFC41_04805, partial [Anaerovoracaceae bacterium]|nr:hypothetical protein [Anaerovoracaceae bacterium]